MVFIGKFFIILHIFYSLDTAIFNIYSSIPEINYKVTGWIKFFMFPLSWFLLGIHFLYYLFAYWIIILLLTFPFIITFLFSSLLYQLILPPFAVIYFFYLVKIADQQFDYLFQIFGFCFHLFWIINKQSFIISSFY
jgi:hypothetical protein